MNKTTPQTKREDLAELEMEIMGLHSVLSVNNNTEGQSTWVVNHVQFVKDIQSLLTRREQEVREEVARDIGRAVKHLPTDKALEWIDYHYLTQEVEHE